MYEAKNFASRFTKLCDYPTYWLFDDTEMDPDKLKYGPKIGREDTKNLLFIFRCRQRKYEENVVAVLSFAQKPNRKVVFLLSVTATDSA